MSLFGNKPALGTVAFNMLPRSGPWGGGNQWLQQMIAFMRFSGYRVVHKLTPDVDCALYTHAGLSGDLAFDARGVAAWKAANPLARCIHRINDNDVRKGTGEMDARLAETDRVSDHTVFVSRWLHDYHRARWLEPARRASVIAPGADPRIFHPVGTRPPRPGEPWRIATHHWSDNPAKGFATYLELDAMIADGQLPGVELWVIGRWPTDCAWRAAKTFAPRAGTPLADLLRQCHLYVTASKFEPGAMHVAEGLQCGLPLLYTGNTGGSVEIGERYGLPLEPDSAATIRRAIAEYGVLRGRLLEDPPSGDLMCVRYARAVQRLIADAREGRK